MKKLHTILLAVICNIAANAQLLTPADGGSSKAMVSEWIGLTQVTINYGRPAVNGREGKIWGGLVYTGFGKLGYGNGIDCPWRAGANENTTIEFSTDVMVDGHPLAAGKYGFSIAYDPAKCTLIFLSNSTSWGSFFYDQREDVLRVNVKPIAITEMRERLTYEFSNEKDSSAVVSLAWEKLAIPFTVSTQLQKLQLASFDRELRGEKGFDPHAQLQVADYLVEQNTRLDEALTYINQASASLPTFSVLMTKGRILEKLNRHAQADSIIQVAMAKGNALEIHNYARALVREKKTQKAFEVFQQNYKRFPNTFTTTMGMARGYAAIGKPKEALKYANMALPLAPDDANKKFAENIISTLKEGKEI